MSTTKPDPKISFNKPLAGLIQTLIPEFDKISGERRSILRQLTEYIQGQIKRNKKVKLLFICTHNSRRSHIAQIWAQAAASYYGIPDVVSYSGGTEATAFNPRAVKAMQDAGFKIHQTSNANNPVYEVYFDDDDAPAVTAFSKKFDSESNPAKDFAAVMTCSHADENCPVVLGMEKRISLPYNDPKDFDGTPHESEKYTERLKEIGTEILFVFSQIKA